MHLKKLSIELQEWGDQKGQYEIEVTYMHERTETKLFLPSDVTNGLLELVSKNILEASVETANRLATSVQNNLLAAPVETQSEVQRA